MNCSRLLVATGALGLLGCGAAAGAKGPGTTAESSQTEAAASLFPGDGLSIVHTSCAREKSPLEFVTAVTRDLFGREPNDVETARTASSGFRRSKFVEEALASPEAGVGVAKFVTGLFGLDALKAEDPELSLEPVVLAQRASEQRWASLFGTSEIYCSERTAALYGIALSPEALAARDGDGYTSCVLPPERAGFFGMISVLRATSPEANPQAFYKQNNNYHRVGAALYAMRGVEMAPAVHAAAGEGPGVPLDSCVPATDARVNADGIAYGTAAVPLQGPNCASCHARLHGPLSVAFRAFGPQGEILNAATLEALTAEERDATPVAHLQAILAERHSCWSVDDTRLPERFLGQAGFARLSATAPTYAEALGVQVPRHLGGVPADANMKTSIAASFTVGGESLSAAFRGFLLSESYRCASK